MLFGGDISHHQGVPAFGSLRAAGWSFVFLKATEGTGFVDPQLASNRANARAAGLIPGLYHFARATDPVAEANFFLRTVGQLSGGELLALDWEVSTGNPVSWCKTFLDVVHASTGVAPVLYVNKYTMNSFNWGGIAQTYGLWLADYDGSTASVPIKDWPVLAFKQYTDTGNVPGISGEVDLDVFFGDAAALARYGSAGAVPTPPPPPPAPPAPSFDVRNWRVSYGQSDAHIPNLRVWANRMYPAYHSTPMSTDASITNYGPQLVSFIQEFGARVGVPNDGRDIGPKISAALYTQGFRG